MMASRGFSRVRVLFLFFFKETKTLATVEKINDCKGV
jgi:hypothetical protein